MEVFQDTVFFFLIWKGGIHPGVLLLVWLIALWVSVLAAFFSIF